MKKILYVEDNKDTAEAVKILLDKEGFETDIVDCGKKGIEMAKRGSYSLFLLDIMLPDMSGWDIFEKLRKMEGKKFIFLSAIPISVERLKELKNAGVSDYITKPFTKEDLIERIRKNI